MGKMASCFRGAPYIEDSSSGGISRALAARVPLRIDACQILPPSRESSQKGTVIFKLKRASHSVSLHLLVLYNSLYRALEGRQSYFRGSIYHNSGFYNSYIGRMCPIMRLLTTKTLVDVSRSGG